jgi:hypothetical protein
MDEDKARIRGSFTSYELTLAAAKDIVQRFMKEQYKWEIEPATLVSQYTLYGEDPVIIADDEDFSEDRFSAWSYARDFATSYCEKKNS